MSSAVDWVAELDLGLAELRLTATAGQREALLRYLALLQRWNGTYNLTSLRDPAQVWSHHLMDCLAVVAPLVRVRGHAPFSLLDVGSGGGLPGVVLSIMLPACAVTCVDTVGKKAAFIRQVALELALPNLRAEHNRVEKLSMNFDVVASRAFATLADFVSLTAARLSSGGVWMAMKARDPESEIVALRPDVEVFHVEQLDVPGLDAQRCIVWMKPRSKE